MLKHDGQEVGRCRDGSDQNRLDPAGECRGSDRRNLGSRGGINHGFEDDKGPWKVTQRPQYPMN